MARLREGLNLRYDGSSVADFFGFPDHAKSRVLPFKLDQRPKNDLLIASRR